MWCVFNWYIAVITHLVVVVVVSTGKMKVHNNDIVYVKRMIVRYWALEKKSIEGQRVFLKENFFKRGICPSEFHMCMCVIYPKSFWFSHRKRHLLKAICVFITEIENHIFERCFWLTLTLNKPCEHKLRQMGRVSQYIFGPFVLYMTLDRNSHSWGKLRAKVLSEALFGWTAPFAIPRFVEEKKQIITHTRISKYS